MEQNVVFNEEIPFRVRQADREERCALLRVVVLTLREGPGQLKHALRVTITEENNSELLYVLEMNEEEFQTLKMDQGIFVDFAAFPVHMVEALNSCMAEANSGEATARTAELNASVSGAQVLLVEATRFKRIVHLRLQLRGGTNQDIIAHLADKVQKLKTERSDLARQLSTTQSRFQQTQTHLETELAQARRDAEVAKSELHRIQLSQAQELALLKENGLKVQTSISEDLERVKKEGMDALARAESEFTKIKDSLNAEILDLKTENMNKTAVLRETSFKLSSIEEEASSLRKEVEELRVRRKTLEGTKVENEVKLQNYEVRMSTLEQQVRDKDEVYKAVNAEKARVEEMLHDVKAQNVKLNDKLRESCDEINKANKIIQAQYSSLKTQTDKNKKRKAMILSLQQTIVDKEKELSQRKADISTLRAEIATKNDKIEAMKLEITSLTEKVKEDEEELKRQKNVVGYLHSHITDRDVATALSSTTGPSIHTYQPNASLLASLAQSKQQVLDTSRRFPSTTTGGIATTTTLPSSSRTASFPLSSGLSLTANAVLGQRIGNISPTLLHRDINNTNNSSSINNISNNIINTASATQRLLSSSSLALKSNTINTNNNNNNIDSSPSSSSPKPFFGGISSATHAVAQVSSKREVVNGVGMFDISRNGGGGGGGGAELISAALAAGVEEMANKENAGRAIAAVAAAANAVY